MEAKLNMTDKINENQIEIIKKSYPTCITTILVVCNVLLTVLVICFINDKKDQLIFLSLIGGIFLLSLCIVTFAYTSIIKQWFSYEKLRLKSETFQRNQADEE